MTIPESVINLAAPAEVRELPFQGYYITSDGHIISTRHRTSARHAIDASRPHKLKALIPPNGYPVVTLWGESGRKTLYIHQLALEAFIGPRPEGLVACHNDGTRTNNAISNLRWDTLSSNALDSQAHGTYSPPPRNDVRGEKNGQAKLSTSDVQSIRALIRAGVTQREIALQYQTTQQTISDIKRGKSWAWLK